MNDETVKPVEKPAKKYRCSYMFGRRQCVLNEGRHKNHKFKAMPGRWTNR